jgi:mediator of RNA polymerase II transcription subunit 28
VKREKMANNMDNLLTEFEKAYAETMATLTQEDTMHERSADTLRVELESKITRFTDLARQMETFFLQKQFLLYAHKPELHLKDDSNDLKQEILRKDELIRKHNERLGTWLKMLQDVQQQSSSVGASVASTSPSSTAPTSPMTGNPRPLANKGPSGGPARIASFPASPYTRMGAVPGSPGQIPMSAGPLASLEKTTTSIGGGTGSR